MRRVEDENFFVRPHKREKRSCGDFTTSRDATQIQCGEVMPRVFAGYSELHTLEGDVVERRRDTRFYFGEQDRRIPHSFGECVGAFYLQNPGSAASLMGRRCDRNGLTSRPWGPLVYADEALLPALEVVLREAVSRVRRRQPGRAEELSRTGYVQILNLSYIRNAADSKEPCYEWRRLVAAKKVRDDCPPASSLRFIVFGWGNAFKRSEDGPRIVSVLQKCIDQHTFLVFPEASSVWNGEAIDVVTNGHENLLHELSRRANYPCGGRHQRAEYPARYAKAVAPVLYRSLLL